MDGNDKIVTIFIISFFIMVVLLSGIDALEKYIQTLKYNENLEQRVTVLEDKINEESI